MYYSFDFTIDKNTDESSKVEQNCKLAPGIIKEIVIQNSKACAGLVYVQIFKSIFQLWPSNPGGAFIMTGEPVPIMEEFEMEGPPWELTLMGWNEDDTFDHTIWVRMSILPKSGPWTASILEALFGVPKVVEIR